MKLNLSSLTAAALLLCAAPAFPQAAATATNVPDLPYKAVPGFFETPPGDYQGESQGTATNSKGDIFVFFRGNPGSRLWEFDKAGKFIREIGKGYYGFLFAHWCAWILQDNIWAVDEGTNVITKFSPDGSKVLMVLGHRPPVAGGSSPPLTVPIRRTRNTPSAARPTWAGTSRSDIFVADGYCNNRVVKYDRNGRFLAEVGSETSRQGARPIQPAACARGRSCRASSMSPTAATTGISARQRPEAENRLHECRVRPGLTASRKARTNICSPPTPIPMAIGREAGPTPARSTRWSWTARCSANSAMPARCRRLPGRAHDGLPQSRRDRRRRDRILACTEARPKPRPPAVTR